MTKEKTLRVVYYIAIALLLFNLVFRLFDQSKMLYQFPLDFTNDGSAYMAQLHFMKVCGFHNACPYWYNGFTSFLVTPPGWFAFALPLYNAFGDVKIAAYVSLIFSLIIIAAGIFLMRKGMKLGKADVLGFFVFFTGNAIAVGNFVRLMRFHEVFAWAMFFLFSAFVLPYKDKRVTSKFVIASMFLALTLMSYMAVGIFAMILLFSLFIYKRDVRERAKIALTLVIAIALSSFWLVPLLANSTSGSVAFDRFSEWLLDFSMRHLLTNIASFAVPAVLLALVFVYAKQQKDNRAYLFLAPVALLSVMFLTRTIVFVPVLKSIWQDPYLLFFIFFMLYLFYSLDLEKLKMKNVAYALIFFISLSSVAINMVKTPLFAENTEFDRNVVEMLDSVDGKFLYLSDDGEHTYSKALYSYAPIYKNLTTAGGFYFHVASKEVLDDVNNISDVKAMECGEFKALAKKLTVTNFITYGGDCERLAACGLDEVKEVEDVCLFKLTA